MDKSKDLLYFQTKLVKYREMVTLPFRSDVKITEVLSRRTFTLSAEIIPPRNGSDQGNVLKLIETLVYSGAQFLSVTKGAGGSLRGGSLPIAQAIKERFAVPCIAHFTCRDLNPAEVENSLMDHHYFGIRNILALRGDPPDGQPNWQAKAGGYNYAFQLIEQIRKLNAGIYITRDNGPHVDNPVQTEFCIGAAAYPDHANAEERIDFFKLKVEAGAEYGITDMLFDPESYARFIEQCQKKNCSIPILPGTRILKSRTQALRMAAKFKAVIPESVLETLPEKEGPDSLSIGLELFLRLSEQLKKYGAPGIHLYVISDVEGASAAIRHLRSEKNDHLSPVPN